MSHSPPAAPPAQHPSFVDGSPAQLANILSSVLQQNADLSAEVVVLKKRLDERITLRDHISTSVTSSSEPIPESALKIIAELEARIQEERALCADLESRLRAWADAWSELERYLHQTELLSASARTSFSQALRDSPNAIVSRLALPKPPPVPPFQRRDPPRSLQAMATMPLPPPPSSRVRHRAESADEHSPPAKRLRADRSRHPAELARPPPYYPELNLHPSAYPPPPPPPPPHAHPHPRHAHHHRSHSHASQHPHHGHSHSRGRSPSLSVSPARSRTRSRSSSLSIDDLLLQVATDERPTSPHGTHIHPSAPTPDPSLVQYQPARPRGRSPSPRGARSHPAPQILQLHGSVQQYQTHVFAPPVTGPPSKKKALEKTNTLVEPLNGSSTPQRYANAAAAAGLPPGGFPATNDKGQRICRQCGLPGRYKDGKCVEKWGPGPEGPGTVCDRCRKKMKRVERRGTLDTLAQAQAQHASFTSPPQLDESPPTHPADAPPRAMGTGLARGNTVTVSHSHPPIATLAEPDSETSPQAYRAPHSHAHPAHPPSRPAGGSASSRSPGSRGSLHGPHSDDDGDGDVEMAPASYAHGGPGKAARVSPPHIHVHAHAPLVRRSSGEDDDAEGEVEDADGEAEDDVDVDDDLLDAVNASEANGHGHVVNGAANGAGVSWVKREADAMEV